MKNVWKDMAEEDTGEDPIKARCAQKSARREQESRQGRGGQSTVANLRRRWRAAAHNLSEHGVLQEPKVVVHDGLDLDLDSAVRCTTGYIVYCIYRKACAYRV